MSGEDGGGGRVVEEPVEERMEAVESQQLESRKEVVDEIDTRPFFCRHINFFVKVWSILTVLGMWVCTVFAIDRRDDDSDFSPWYCLGSTILVSLLELLWFINKCAICRDKGGCCCTCWRVLMWIDNWKKGIFFIILCVPYFIRLELLVLIAGVLLAVLGLVYVIKSFSNSPCVGGKKYVKRHK